MNIMNLNINIMNGALCVFMPTGGYFESLGEGFRRLKEAQEELKQSALEEDIIEQ